MPNVPLMKRITQISAAILCAARIFAATETHTVTISEKFTNWTNSISLPQFDPAVGTLISATLYVSVTNFTQTKIENHDDVSWVVVSGSKVDASIVGYVTATDQNTFTNTLSAFDGTDDFAGTSGVVNPLTTASASNSAALVPASVLGTGEIPFVVTAKANAIFEGPGDYLFLVSTKASAKATIVYEFDPECPTAPKPVCEPKPFYCFPPAKGYGCRRP